MNYRTIEDLNRDVKGLIPKLPATLDLVVGIPRSGLLAASLLALHLNLPVTDVDGLCEKRVLETGLYRRFGRVFDFSRCRKVLVIDDSINSGASMKKAKSAIQRANLPYDINYAAVYVTCTNYESVDFWCDIVDHPRCFEWNVMHHPKLEVSCVDLDGVLCRDPTESENDDGDNYRGFLVNVEPLIRPSVEIGWIVTCRLEKYRHLTEQWLKKQGIEYKKLVMMNLPDKETRVASGSHARFKAEVYRTTNAWIFIESSLVQAEQITAISGKAVLCTETNQIIRQEAKNMRPISNRRPNVTDLVVSHRPGLEAHVKELNQSVATLEAELSAVYSSYSWRITAPLRAGYRSIEWVLRNTRRTFKLLWWLSTGQFTRAGQALLPYYRRYVPQWVDGLLPHRIRQAASRCLVADDHKLSTRYMKFDLEREREFNRKIANLFEKSKSRFEAVKVSVVMPTYNRQHMIGRAVQSVISQSHKNWELLIIDDGSTDETAEVIKTFLQDKRIKFIKQQHLGLSAARNSGVERASGEIIAYLDTDNVWRPNFLRNMIVFMISEGYKCAYAGLAVRNDRGQITYYRGRQFDWDSCLKENYIDLNVYCHHRELRESGLCFDENLRRMIDWDLILSHARKVGQQVGYAPFIGCGYLDSRDDRDRVSIKQPLLYKRIIQLKHSSSSGLGPKAIAEQLSFNIAIKIADPLRRRLERGDYDYADSLAAAFRKLGHAVRIDFSGADYNHPIGKDDVVIVLRGLTKYEPQPGPVNIMWNISHPDQVAYSEYDKYDLVYVASLTYPNVLRYVTKVPVRALLQATDTERFQPLSEKDPRYTDEIIFVGNSRNEYRKIVKWAVEKGLPLAIYGKNWEQFVPSGLIKASNISNESLPALYFSAKVVLNDHWESMAEYGFLSNRLFDVIAAGGRVISDAVPSIRTVFGSAVTEVKTPDELEYAIKQLSFEDTSEHQEYAAQTVRANHSLELRSRQITDDVLKFLGLPALYEDDMKRKEGQSAAPAVNTNKPLKVNAFARWDGDHPESSAFIRLLNPLTTKALAGGVELKLIPPSHPRDIDKGDVYIVQRTAFDNREAAEALVDEIRKEGSRLIVDNDDAFCLMDSSHPEHDFHSDKNSALVYLMEMADETWFATPTLAEAYSNHSTNPEVMPDAIDPRIWRNYRKKWRPIGSNKKLRMVYMGTGTNDGDFEVILPALDEVARMRPNSFELTIIGAVTRPPNRRWLQNVSPPRTATAYPRFARWLLQQPAWDVGLAPLADTPFNNCKSDIKFLEYTALGVVSVVSDCAPYRASAVESGGAILVKNSTDNWRDTFLNLIDNLTQFRSIVDAAWEYVWSKRHVSVLAHQQMMALRRITL